MELPEVVVVSMSEAMVTSWRELESSEEVVIADVEEVCKDDDVVLPEEEEDVHVGGVDDVSRQARVEDKLRSSEFVDEKLGISGIAGGRGGVGGGAIGKAGMEISMTEESLAWVPMPSSGAENALELSWALSMSVTLSP